MGETREVIQVRMLSNISSEYDKSQGSFFYDATAPVAIEMERMGSKADSLIDKVFAATATGADLDKVAKDQGLTRKSATKATGIVTVTGVIGAVIAIGEMVASDKVNFIFKEDGIISASGTLNVSVECEQYGVIGNVPMGAIKYFPKTLEGLQSVTNAAEFLNGYEAETDEELRERYYTKVRTPATSGNKYHYLNWAVEVTGVGGAKVKPLWNGKGTVKVVIINSNKRAADSALINAVVDHIEENRPIGASVTVSTGVEKSINFSAQIVLTNEITLNEVQLNFEQKITEFFKDIAFSGDYISYANISNILFNTQGLADFSNLTVNGGTINIPLLDEEVPVIGAISLEV